MAREVNSSTWFIAHLEYLTLKLARMVNVISLSILLGVLDINEDIELFYSNIS